MSNYFNEVNSNNNDNKLQNVIHYNPKTKNKTKNKTKRLNKDNNMKLTELLIIPMFIVYYYFYIYNCYLAIIHLVIISF
jgi:hypothetical protein